MFRKILVANRGEIALRVIRAASELGISTVAIYSDVDVDSLPVQLADEAVCVGPAPASKSYLNIQNIISAALVTGADAIHPGYGFLAESSFFAEVCQAHGIKFIGPTPEAISRMGDKAQAKATMVRAGLPVIPGTDGAISNEIDALRFAAKSGYPVIVKAAGGGGGKGMRIARSEAELKKAVKFAAAEAQAAFGTPALYVEKFIEHPRHVEIQVIADEKGNCAYLGERDCSLQRKHQKIVEEAPSPCVTPDLREKMGQAAMRGVMAVGYTSVGTMEFLVDGDGNFYFMEMNTRIQVEHPVTEMVTGVDLVKEQILIASGEALSIRQDDIQIKGHSIECRICAEDPARNFAPSPGTVTDLHLPGGPGIRVDTALYRGASVPPNYDSLVAKVIAWGRDRSEAIARMERALDELIVEGISTNVNMHRGIMRCDAFRRAEIHSDDDVISCIGAEYLRQDLL
ncbi:MAG TPA: acetyl-CoA carboxylase biotin carboxylase subunit [Firmicutes bacterium]|nr:acetyl-CoA carboxylase biotin carboxylase subunit [Bacillota bacterium]HHY97297.1 acetyl-CoA carboxylase biotin carboxylase subunit [Bacillota bacterium]